MFPWSGSIDDKAKHVVVLVDAHHLRASPTLLDAVVASLAARANLPGDAASSDAADSVHASKQWRWSLYTADDTVHGCSYAFRCEPLLSARAALIARRHTVSSSAPETPVPNRLEFITNSGRAEQVSAESAAQSSVSGVHRLLLAVHEILRTHDAEFSSAQTVMSPLRPKALSCSGSVKHARCRILFVAPVPRTVEQLREFVVGAADDYEIKEEASGSDALSLERAEVRECARRLGDALLSRAKQLESGRAALFWVDTRECDDDEPRDEIAQFIFNTLARTLQDSIGATLCADEQRRALRTLRSPLPIGNAASDSDEVYLDYIDATDDKSVSLRAKLRRCTTLRMLRLQLGDDSAAQRAPLPCSLTVLGAVPATLLDDSTRAQLMPIYATSAASAEMASFALGSVATLPSRETAADSERFYELCRSMHSRRILLLLAERDTEHGARVFLLESLSPTCAVVMQCARDSTAAPPLLSACVEYADETLHADHVTASSPFQKAGVKRARRLSGKDVLPYDVLTPSPTKRRRLSPRVTPTPVRLTTSPRTRQSALSARTSAVARALSSLERTLKKKMRAQTSTPHKAATTSAVTSTATVTTSTTTAVQGSATSALAAASMLPPSLSAAERVERVRQTCAAIADGTSSAERLSAQCAQMAAMLFAGLDLSASMPCAVLWSTVERERVILSADELRAKYRKLMHVDSPIKRKRRRRDEAQRRARDEEQKRAEDELVREYRLHILLRLHLAALTNADPLESNELICLKVLLRAVAVVLDARHAEHRGTAAWLETDVVPSLLSALPHTLHALHLALGLVLPNALRALLFPDDRAHAPSSPRRHASGLGERAAKERAADRLRLLYSPTKPRSTSAALGALADAPPSKRQRLFGGDDDGAGSGSDDDEEREGGGGGGGGAHLNATDGGDEENANNELDSALSKCSVVYKTYKRRQRALLKAREKKRRDAQRRAEREEAARAAMLAKRTLSTKLAPSAQMGVLQAPTSAAAAVSGAARPLESASGSAAPRRPGASSLSAQLLKRSGSTNLLRPSSLRDLVRAEQMARLTATKKAATDVHLL